MLSLEISNFVNIQFGYIFLSLILFYIYIFLIIYPYLSLYLYFITFVLIYHLFECYDPKSKKFMLMKYQETCFLSPHLPRKTQFFLSLNILIKALFFPPILEYPQQNPIPFFSLNSSHKDPSSKNFTLKIIDQLTSPK